MKKKKKKKEYKQEKRKIQKSADSSPPLGGLHNMWTAPYTRSVVLNCLVSEYICEVGQNILISLKEKSTDKKKNTFSVYIL